MQHYHPMLLTPAETLPVGPEWSYEPKLDGWRMLGYVGASGVSLISRRGTNYTDRFPQVVDELPEAMWGQSVVVDGELVGLDASGKEDRKEVSRRNARVVHYIFDILEVNGRPIIHLPLYVRRNILSAVFEQQDHVRRVTTFVDRDSLVLGSQERGMEGVVAKKINSVYMPGRRSKAWLKKRNPYKLDAA